MAAFAELLGLELRRRLRDPIALVAWLAIPFLMVALMVTVFGPRGAASLPRVTVLIVDRDGGFLARALVSALDSPQLADLLDVGVHPEAEARRLMDRGKASLMVVVPGGFTSDFLANRPVALEVYRNPQESVLPRIGEEVVAVLADAGGLLRAVLEPLTNGVVDRDPLSAPSLAEVTELTRRVWTLLDDPAAANLLAVDRIQVVDRHPDEKKLTRSEVVGWFAPGLVGLALLFLCTGQSQEVQEDLVHRRLERAWSFPSRSLLAFGAKTAALVVTTSASALLLVIALAGVLGWRPGSAPLVVLSLVLTAAAFSGLSLLLRSLTRNPEAGGVAASGVMVGLGFLGGCFIPVVFLPAALRHVADLIPTGWAVETLLILQGSTWAGDLGTIGWRLAALAATAAVSFALAGWLMRKRAAEA